MAVALPPTKMGKTRNQIGSKLTISLIRVLGYSLLVTVAIPLLAVSAHAQSTDTKTKGTASISGRVTIGDKPAPGILVIASIHNEAGRSTTDADGEYRIDGLNAGRFVVIPVAPRFVVPVSSITQSGTPVNLHSGEAVDGIDFKLTHGGVITGHVTDADGQLVIEQRIDLHPVDEKGNALGQRFLRYAFDQMYFTDDRGVYRIYGLPAGQYKVSVGSEPGLNIPFSALGSYPTTYYSNASGPTKPSIIDLKEGLEAKNIDIHLGRRAQTYIVKGRIVDNDTGQPVPGARVALGVVQDKQYYIGSWSSPRTPTDSKGQFRLDGVEPGRYGVFVEPSRISMDEDATHPNVYSDPVYFDVIDADVADLEIKAQRGVILSGLVVPEGIEDKKLLPRLSQFRIGAYVEQTQGNKPGPSFGNLSATIGADGSFQIQGLPPGRVSFNLRWSDAVDATGFAISRIEHDGAPRNRGIEIQPGQIISGVRVYVAYGTASIRGQVKIEGGTLPENSAIYIRATKEGSLINQSSIADARGYFVIEHLPAGTYQVATDFTWFASARGDVSVRSLPTQRQTVTLTDGAESEVLFTLDLGRKNAP